MFVRLSIMRKVSLAGFLIVGLTSIWFDSAESHLQHRTKQRRDVPRYPVVDWNVVAEDTLKLKLEVASRPNTNVARNVILFLGDGMGISTVTAGRIYMGQQNGGTGEEAELAFDRFPHVALAKTYNVDFQVPDSAGTATAFMSGVKANLGVIGVNQFVKRKICENMTGNAAESIVRWSLRAGKRTGVVTTTRITHATPSAGYAHSPDRDWESDAKVPANYRYKPLCADIADQMITNNSDVNVYLGGGRKNFLPKNQTNGTRLDGRNLIEEWKQKMNGKSHAYVENKRQFDAVDVNQVDYLLGLFNDDHMQYRLQQRHSPNPEPSLADMTEKAIRILQRGRNGYFLLVEGGRIDHGHHAATAKMALDEVVGFNEAVQRAISLTDESDTLLVVTADHSHVFTIGGYPSRGNGILRPLDEKGFAEEPALDNMPYLTLMYANGPGIANRTNLTNVNTEDDYFKQPVNVPLGSETHGGEDVAVYARGPMSHLFAGVFEQNYVAHAMAYASCVGSNRKHCGANNSAVGPHAKFNGSIAWRLSAALVLLILLLLQG